MVMRNGLRRLPKWTWILLSLILIAATALIFLHVQQHNDTSPQLGTYRIVFSDFSFDEPPIVGADDATIFRIKFAD
jgi:hypothetical protein